MMRKTYIVALLGLAVLMLWSCKSAKKAASYQEVYSEHPVNIYIAPVENNARRALVKSTQDQLYNQELKEAAVYMQQTLADPLINLGYYCMAPLMSDTLFRIEGKTFQQLASTPDLSEYYQRYGMDAVLLVSISRWEEPSPNQVDVYAEYILRSTKTGTDLLHTWVRGRKQQPVDYKGESVELTSDIAFMNRTGITGRLAHRCILLQQMSDFVLRNLPTSVERRQYKRDQFTPANENYYTFTYNYNGEIEISDYPADAQN